MNVKIKLLDENAKVPFHATMSSAGYDLTATSVIFDSENDCWVYGLGFATEFDPEYVAKIYPRSSNRKTDYYMPNSVGIVDADYRGEWLISLKSRDFTNLRIPPYKVGERVGQVIFEKKLESNFEKTETLTTTARNTGGHGSTGK